MVSSSARLLAESCREADACCVSKGPLMGRSGIRKKARGMDRAGRMMCATSTSQERLLKSHSSADAPTPVWLSAVLTPNQSIMKVPRARDAFMPKLKNPARTANEVVAMAGDVSLDVSRMAGIRSSICARLRIIASPRINAALSGRPKRTLTLWMMSRSTHEATIRTTVVTQKAVRNRQFLTHSWKRTMPATCATLPTSCETVW
mmetsp:Transcript_35433/g.101843  ORF Transcript_35433/g.101843 Transcript_35433/m.101843 type:complete len:204 (+) Transcript_35433:532-1143(+)